VTIHELTLDQLGSLSRGRSRHRPRDAAFLYGGPFPFVQTGDVKRAGLYLTEYEQTYSEAGLAQSRLWPAGTLCITIAANIADTAILGIDACFPDSVIGFTADPEKADTRFVKYLFDGVLKTKFQSFTQGAAQDNLSQEKLLSIKFPVPEPRVQCQIARILSAYDDLIENNRRRIALLEEAARLLYREWFVRFRFPGHEHVKIIDGIPNGWNVQLVATICETYDDGDWLETKDQGGTDYRIIQISNIGDNCFIETGSDRYITEETFRQLNCHEVVPGDILVSRMPRPIGRGWTVSDMPFRMVTAVDVTIVRPDQKRVLPHYLLHHINSKQNISRCEAHATGTTRPRISRKNMGRLPILLPPLSLQRQFSDFAGQNHRLKVNLFGQNQKLAQARDLLLPRLMNGEIAI
jgi:type I restriction enzyme, S subunit